MYTLVELHNLSRLFDMKLREREKAIKLRRQGHSLKRISDSLNVSKSTVSVWVRDLDLSPRSKKLLTEMYTKGQISSQESHKAKKRRRLEESRQKAITILRKANLNDESNKVLCSLIYWCEGAKKDSLVTFINSDPDLISTFLRLLRNSFDLDEKKFRVCVHVHGYHNENLQTAFWSRITGIPKNQFLKSYKKKNGGKVIRKNYQGCASIRYYDARIAQDLLAIAREYILKGP